MAAPAQVRGARRPGGVAFFSSAIGRVGRGSAVDVDRDRVGAGEQARHRAALALGDVGEIHPPPGQFGALTQTAGFTVKLDTVFGENNQWTMQLDNVNQSQCATLVTTFTGPGVVRIATNGNAVSNPAYSSVFSQNSSATWPPSTASLTGQCHKGANNIKWTFTD